MDDAIKKEYGGAKAKTLLITADGEEIRYTVCNHTEGMILCGIGAMFMGMVSTGLGEMNGYFLLQRCRVPSKVSVATSVFVVAVTALATSAGHFVKADCQQNSTAQFGNRTGDSFHPCRCAHAGAGDFLTRLRCCKDVITSRCLRAAKQSQKAGRLLRRLSASSQ